MITAFIQFVLFLWFFLSMYLVYNDTTISTELKVLGEFVNLVCIEYILANMLNQNSGFLFYTIGVSLLMWYIYFTPQDMMNAGYKPFEKFVYVAVDLSMIVYLTSSLIIAFSHQFVNKYSLIQQINQFQTSNFNWF